MAFVVGMRAMMTAGYHGTACLQRKCWNLVASALCVAMHAGGRVLFTTAIQEQGCHAAQANEHRTDC